MSAVERLAWIVSLDEKILKSDVVLPGWCTTIVTAVAGIESYLRSQEPVVARKSLKRLIDDADIPIDLKLRTHSPWAESSVMPAYPLNSFASCCGAWGGQKREQAPARQIGIAVAVGNASRKD